MNTVALIGRLTKDVDLRYTPQEMAVAKFSLAIDDGYGEKKKTNFIPVIVFGKQAENCEKYLARGKMVGVKGKIQTGSYEKDGKKVYTTDVIAEQVYFIDWGEKKHDDDIPAGFQEVIGDVPF